MIMKTNIIIWLKNGGKSKSGKSLIVSGTKIGGTPIWQ